MIPPQQQQQVQPRQAQLRGQHQQGYSPQGQQQHGATQGEGGQAQHQVPQQRIMAATGTVPDTGGAQSATPQAPPRVEGECDYF
eukprot:15481111-Alexandrium_andersonii.AAC.1